MSLARRIIPCLDTDGERVVKGVNFVALRDAGDPVALAARYNAEGADELGGAGHCRVARSPPYIS